MSDKLTQAYLMNIIKENVGNPVQDAMGKSAMAANGAVNMIPQPVAQPGTAQANQATLAARGTAMAVSAPPSMKQEEEPEDSDESDEGEEEEMKEAVEFEQSLRSLLGEVELSEEFFVQVKTLFEAAVDQKLKAVAEEIAPTLQEEFESKLGEVTMTLTEKIDDYLDYVVEEWMQDNKLAVETGIKGTLAENFIVGLKKLFEMHYIDVPAEKYNVLDGLYEQAGNLQNDLNDTLRENIELKKQLLITECAGIFVAETKDLADTQVEKLASLIENIEFSNVEDYKTKLLTLKEHYLGSKVAVPEQPDPELTFSKPASVPTTLVESYANSLTRLAKKI
jgi:hypothetical protein